VKEYKIELPDRLKEKEKEIKEYLIIKQYEDNILRSGACAYLLGIKKSVFLTETVMKYNIDFLLEEEE